MAERGGPREIRTGAADETWVEVAKNKYGQNRIAAVDDYVSLPRATGGENFTGVDVLSARKTEKSVKPLKGLFDTEREDDEF
jgi:hypothetical protein